MLEIAPANVPRAASATAPTRLSDSRPRPPSPLRRPSCSPDCPRAPSSACTAPLSWAFRFSWFATSVGRRTRLRRGRLLPLIAQVVEEVTVVVEEALRALLNLPGSCARSPQTVYVGAGRRPIGRLGHLFSAFQTNVLELPRAGTILFLDRGSGRAPWVPSLTSHSATVVRAGRHAWAGKSSGQNVFCRSFASRPKMKRTRGESAAFSDPDALSG